MMRLPTACEVASDADNDPDQFEALCFFVDDDGRPPRFALTSVMVSFCTTRRLTVNVPSSRQTTTS
jgi:hypothetical protein